MERRTPEGDALLIAMLKQRIADGSHGAGEAIAKRLGVGAVMRGLERFHTGFDPATGEDLTQRPLLPNAENGGRMGEIAAWLGMPGRPSAKGIPMQRLDMAPAAPVPQPEQGGMGADAAYQTMLGSDDPEAKRRAMIVYALKGGA